MMRIIKAADETESAIADGPGIYQNVWKADSVSGCRYRGVLKSCSVYDVPSISSMEKSAFIGTIVPSAKRIVRRYSSIFFTIPRIVT